MNGNHCIELSEKDDADGNAVRNIPCKGIPLYTMYTLMNVIQMHPNTISDLFCCSHSRIVLGLRTSDGSSVYSS